MKVQIDALTDAIMAGLNDFKDATTDDVKAAVKQVGNAVKKDIKCHAPVGISGAYQNSWTVKKTKENSHRLSVTVHSKNHYQLAHLLEFGHANRGGGRTLAQPHIKPAEAVGVSQLEEVIIRSIGRG